MASSSVFLGVMHASIRVDILRRYYDTPAMQQLPVCCLVHSSHWRKAQYLVTLDTKRLQGLSWSVESSVSPLQCLQAWCNCGFYRQKLSLPLSILLEIEHCRTLCICRPQHESKNAPGSPHGSRTSFTNFPFQRTTSTSTKLGSTSPVLCDLLLSVLRYTSLWLVMARTQKANLSAILKRNVWHDASPSLLILSPDIEITDQICSFCELSKPRSDLHRANLFRSSTDKNFFLPSFVDIIRTLSNKTACDPWWTLQKKHTPQRRGAKLSVLHNLATMHTPSSSDATTNAAIPYFFFLGSIVQTPCTHAGILEAEIYVVCKLRR